MTDDSKFVLHWKINNAAAKFAARKVESKVFNEGGFEWNAYFEREGDSNSFDLNLTCNHEQGGEWKCEVDAESILIGEKDFSRKRRATFTNGDKVFKFAKFAYECAFTDSAHGYLNCDGTANMKFDVNIISSMCAPEIDVTKFSSPNESSNVTLVIGDNKLKVSTDYLAIHSPVFAAMFFGDYAEKGKEEVEIKEVVYEEFIDLLHLIYLRTVGITDRSVLHILKLADQFQIEIVMNLSEKHLKTSTKFDVAKKLLLADQYRLASLKDHCLQSFTSITDLTGKLKSSPEFANYSEWMKSAICEQIMEF